MMLPGNGSAGQRIDDLDALASSSEKLVKLLLRISWVGTVACCEPRGAEERRPW